MFFYKSEQALQEIKKEECWKNLSDHERNIHSAKGNYLIWSYSNIRHLEFLNSFPSLKNKVSSVRKSIVEGVLAGSLNFKYKESKMSTYNLHVWCIADFIGGGGVGTALFSHGSDNYYHNIMKGEINLTYLWEAQGSILPLQDPDQEDRHFTIESCDPLMSFTNNTGINRGYVLFFHRSNHI